MSGKRDLGWWSISGEDFLEAMRRVKQGENPDFVYAEYYANSDHEYYPKADG